MGFLGCNVYDNIFFFSCVDEKRELEGRGPLRPVGAGRGQKPLSTKETERLCQR